MRHFLVFGTHPRISLAEFRAVRPLIPRPTLCGSAALIDDPAWDGGALMNQLGGTVKLGDIVLATELQTFDEHALAEFILSRPRGGEKILFGLGVYGGTPAAQRRLEKIALPLKRRLTDQGRSVRWVTAEDGKQLSPAAVAKLKLASEGYDIALLIHGTRLSVGLTTHVQDATAWSERDYGRPVRDDENGMLPPKLARIMINMARVPEEGCVLDPFCGSGTVLMEAALTTHARMLIGSDIEAKYIADAQQNTEWLIQKRILRPEDTERFQYLVRDVKKLNATVIPSSVHGIVTEGYLGPPLKGNESQATLQKNAEDISALWSAALRTLHPLLDPHGRIVAIWPSFKTSHGVARVDLTDKLPELGFTLINPLSGWDDTHNPLLYHRPGQHVMRRIVVMEKL